MTLTITIMMTIMDMMMKKLDQELMALVVEV